MMKNSVLLKITAMLVLVIAITVCAVGCTGESENKLSIVIDGGFASGSTIEYTGEAIQFPVAHVENSKGEVVSYNVTYQLVNLADNSTKEDAYATFDVKTGEYALIYTYAQNKNVSTRITFSVKDTTSPVIEFTEIPNGLFLQDITEDDVLKLPGYTMTDVSMDEGLNLKKTLYFKADGATEYTEHSYRDINNSYEADTCGTFKFELIATDIYGNSTTAVCQWKIKDHAWKPETEPVDGYLADYAEEGYTNLIEGGNVNQYYMIGNNYADSFLPEFEGAKGVMKIDMGFNSAAGYGYNTIKLHFSKTFTPEDIENKYLAVRIYVEGEHLGDQIIFGGNNVAFREEDQTTRAFSTTVTGLKTGKWMTYYIDAATVLHIGVYPNATYNPDTTFYEGGDPAECIQLCFRREAGYSNDMTLYVDSITLAEKLPDTEVTVQDGEAVWTAVDGASGYAVRLNDGQVTVYTDTKCALPGAKGYLIVTPLGDGALTLDAGETVAVYGLDAGDKLAAFDDELYIKLLSDKLNFSTAAEHVGYQPQYYSAELTEDGVKLDLGTGNWGVVTGIKVLFPNPMDKGSNTTLVMNLNVSNDKYGSMRVYDLDGRLLQNIALNSTNTGKLYRFEVDLKGYDKTLTGVQLVFGPNNMQNVPGGVEIIFRDMFFENVYYTIQIGGKDYTCVGEKTLKPGYTQKDLVQFGDVFDFGVTADDTPLYFEGTVMLDGKKVDSVIFVGYPNTSTICLKVPHGGKILTILKGSVIYSDKEAVIVEKTFNMKWNGSAWEEVSEIPSEPEDEYITVGGQKRKVVNKTELTPHYTLANLVQFGDVADFGVEADDTPLFFEGTVLIDGVAVENPLIVGYRGSTTICLKGVSLNGKVLTILKDSVIYYGDKAVIVTKTFNAKWDGTNWIAVSEIPTPPEKEYVTVNGEEKEVVAKVELTAGYTQNDLVQFVDVYNFGASEDDTALFFNGTVLIDGVAVQNPLIVGYKNNKTICLKGVSLNGKVLTILKDSIIYYGDKAVVVTKTFNAKWDGTAWTAVSEIPTPPEKEYVTVNGEEKEVVAKVELTAGYTADVLVQFTGVYNFGLTEQAAIGFSGRVLLDGVEQSSDLFRVDGYNGTDTICLNIAHKGKVLTVMENSVIYYGDKAVIVTKTFNAKWDGSKWNAVAEIPKPGEPTEPDTPAALELAYRYGTENLIQLNTNLPSGTPLANFTAGENGCNIDQSLNKYQQVGWIGMDNVNGTIVLTFHFNNAFEAGQTYILKSGSVFGFTDGKSYTLDKDYVFTWDGSNWTMSNELPAEPTALELAYRYGTENLIQLNTNLPSGTPLANFTAGENGCNIDQSLNKYQQVGWIGMDNVNGTIVLTFHFNNAFEAGQTYILKSGSVFGFTDGKSYTLDKDYVFTWDGSNWTMSNELPAEPTALELAYRYGTNNLIQLNTNLPSDTPLANFTAGENGCNIDQSLNQYQQVGWIGMDNVDGTIVLTFHFNNAFEAGQTYILKSGSVFGFTDGKSYTLDKDYVFTWDGSSWSLMVQ